MVGLLNTKVKNEATISDLIEQVKEQKKKNLEVIESTHGAFDKISDFSIQVAVLEGEKKRLEESCRRYMNE